jgi:Do/DeqQ family serine protease
MMHRIWLIFTQAVTVAVAALFVVATLKPEWLGRRAGFLPTATVIHTSSPLPAAPNTAASGAATPAAAPTSLAAAARAASPAVVSIMAQRGASTGAMPDDPQHRFRFGNRQPRQAQVGLGSGVIVAPEGYLLTNQHVIDGADEIDVQLADGRQARAQVVGGDAETDIAVLKIDLPQLPVISLGDPARLQVGDPVLAIGSPFSLGQTVTAGIVSALGRNRLRLSTYEDFIQTDAAINPGNSGGALVDASGALVGINTAIFSRSGGSQGIGFAVPVDLAREVLAALLKDGRVVRGWIGVEIVALTPEIAESLKLTAQTGVLLSGVLQEGPSAAAGLRPGDVVTKLDGQAVASEVDFMRLVAGLKPGSTVTLRVLRGREPLDVSVRVSQRPRVAAR